MKPEWLLCNLGKDEHIQSLYYGILEAGCKATVLSLGEFANILEDYSDEKKNIITCGSIWLSSYIRQQRPNWLGCFHSKETFLCSNYYKYWDKYITQKKYLFTVLSDVKNHIDEYAIDGYVFIRPDSGEKEFPGTLVRVKDFEYWIKEVTDIQRVKLEEKVIISSPVKIDREARLIIVDKKVVSGSLYKIAKNLWFSNIEEDPCRNEIIEFAETVLNDNPPVLPPFHVLDIAIEEDGRKSVMEVGCFCCCGIYACDRKKVAKEISLCMERMWNKNEI